MTKSILKVGAIAAALSAIGGLCWLFFGHIALANDTAKGHKETASIVDELVEIRLKENSAKQAKNNLMRRLCAAEMLNDPMQCKLFALEDQGEMDAETE